MVHGTQLHVVAERPRAAERTGLIGLASVVGLLLHPLPFAGAGLFGLLLLAGQRWRRIGRPFAASSFDWPLLLQLLGAVPAVLIAVRLPTAEVRFFGLIAALGLFYLVLDLGADPRASRRLVVGALLLLGTLAPLLLLLAIPDDLDTARLPAPLAGLIAASAPRLVGLRDLVLGLEGPIILQRFRLHSGGLSLAGAAGLGLALGLLLAPRDRRERLVGLLAAGYFGLFLLLGGSRGTMLSTALVVLLLAAVRWRWLLLVAAVLVAVTAGALTWQIAQFSSGGWDGRTANWATSATSVGQRLELWSNGLLVLGYFPLSGVGLGIASVKVVYDSYVLPYSYPFSHAHNVLVQTALEQGLLGLLGLLGLVAVGIVVGWRAIGRSDAGSRGLALSGVGLALTLLLSGLTSIGVLTTVAQTLLFGALGLLAAVERSASGQGALGIEHRAPGILGRRRSPRITVWLVLGLLVSGAVLAGPLGPAHTLGSRLLAAVYLNVGSVDSSAALLGRGWTPAERQARLERARASLEQAAALEPTNARVLTAQAQVDLARGERDLALRRLVEAEGLLGGSDQRLLFQVGRLYQEAGALDAAVAVWTRVDRLIGAWNGSGPDTQLILWGAELVRRGRWADAATVNRGAIQAAPVTVDGYRGLRRALTGLSGPDVALEALTSLAAAEPDVPWPYQEAAEAARLAGQPNAAANWSARAKVVSSSRAWPARRRQALTGGGFLFFVPR